MSRELVQDTDLEVYTEANFPSYAFLEARNVRFLDKRSYEHARSHYIGRLVPAQQDTPIPEKYKDLSWKTYAIILSIRYESG